MIQWKQRNAVIRPSTIPQNDDKVLVNIIVQPHELAKARCYPGKKFRETKPQTEDDTAAALFDIALFQTSAN
jgi:hypothetical protein